MYHNEPKGEYSVINMRDLFRIEWSAFFCQEKISKHDCQSNVMCSQVNRVQITSLQYTEHSLSQEHYRPLLVNIYGAVVPSALILRCANAENFCCE